jgi:hypothetical protein
MSIQTKRDSLIHNYLRLFFPHLYEQFVSNPSLTEREEGELRDIMFFQSFSALHPSLLHHRCVERLWFDSLAYAYSDALMLIR